MSIMRRFIIVAVALLLVSVAKAQPAGIGITGSIFGFTQPPEETLEWMVCDSIAVVRATIKHGPTYQTTFQVSEVIKGNLTVGSIMAIDSRFRIRDDLPGKEALLFLQLNKGGESQPIPFRYRDGRTGFLLDGTERVILMDRITISRPQEIMAAARQAASYTPAAKGHVSLTDTGVSGADTLLFPSDRRLESLARRWAERKSIEDRILAMQAMQGFKSDANITLITRLLFDTRCPTPRGAGKWQVGYYPVRAAAKDLLTKWKVGYPTLPETGPIFIYRPLDLPSAVLICAILGLVLLFAAMIIWRKTVMVRWTIALLAIASIAAVSLLWRRTASQADEIMFAVGDAHHEIASYSGGIQYQVLHDWDYPRQLVYGSFDRKLNEDVWAIDSQNPTRRRSLLGFCYASGIATGPGGTIHRFGLLRIPFWGFLAVLILPLSLDLVSLVHQIRRRRRGLCRNCGYDLRETRNGRCPECGNSIAREPSSPALVQTADRALAGGQAIGT